MIWSTGSLALRRVVELVQTFQGLERELSIWMGMAVPGRQDGHRVQVALQDQRPRGVPHALLVPDATQGEVPLVAPSPFQGRDDDVLAAARRALHGSHRTRFGVVVVDAPEDIYLAAVLAAHVALQEAGATETHIAGLRLR